jgi:hypothetical protein
MVAINFPDAPFTGQVFTVGSSTWTWDGYKWASGLSPAGYLPLSGGTMTGPITLPGNAAAALQVVPLRQVPVASTTTPLMDGTAAIGVGTTWARADHVHASDTSRLALTGGTLTGNLTVNGNLSSAGTITGGVFTSTNGYACRAGAGGALSGNDFNINWTSSTAQLWIDGTNLGQINNCLPLAGGTVTGGLGVNGTFQANNGYIILQGVGTNPIIYQIFNSAGSGVAQFYWNPADSTVYFTDQPAGSSFRLSANCWAVPGSGANFIVNNGVGYQTGGGPWSALSDARIKTVEAEYKQGLDEVLKLRPVVYIYKGNETIESPLEGSTFEAAPYPRSMHYEAARNSKRLVGLVAQETEITFPEMVSSREGWIDGVKVEDLRDLNTGPLIFALVNAVKTLAARVEALEARVA